MKLEDYIVAKLLLVIHSIYKTSPNESLSRIKRMTYKTESGIRELESVEEHDQLGRIIKRISYYNGEVTTTSYSYPSDFKERQIIVSTATEDRLIKEFNADGKLIYDSFAIKGINDFKVEYFFTYEDEKLVAIKNIDNTTILYTFVYMETGCDIFIDHHGTNKKYGEIRSLETGEKKMTLWLNDMPVLISYLTLNEEQTILELKEETYDNEQLKNISKERFTYENDVLRQSSWVTINPLTSDVVVHELVDYDENGLQLTADFKNYDLDLFFLIETEQSKMEVV